MQNKRVRDCVFETISNNKLLCALICALIVSIVAVSLAPPQILRIIIDTKLSPRITNGLPLLAALFLSAYLLNYILEATKEAILVIFGQKITKAIRSAMATKALRTHSSYFTSNSSGEVSSRFLSDVDKIGELFTGGVAGMAVDCFKIIGIIGSIFFFSTRLGIMVLVLLPIIALVTRKFQSSVLRAQKKTRVYIGALSSHISESIRNLRTIKLTGCENFMEGKYSACLSKNFSAQDRVNFFDSIYSPIIIVLRTLSICTLVVLTASGAGFFSITLGMVAASIELISSLFSPIESLGMELSAIQSAFSGISRVNEFFSLPECSPADLRASALPSPCQNIIEFQNVCFSYDGKTEILKNINLNIQIGESITFSGRTGAGKTTLFNLVMGLYTPTKGSLKICGCECSRLCPADKRRLIGYVCQSFDYVPGDVYDQITLGDSSITHDAVHSAMILTQMHQKILSLPQGYSTKIENTEFFSQGEKQLLSIARAVCTNPQILLLDEITAGLDSLTEAKIMQVLQKVRKSHTILTISHRLTSVLFCDKVVCLDKGHIDAIETTNF